MADAVGRPESLPASIRWAGLALGFGLGGFFDGILLHQVLQWHHLLSALDGAVFQDIRIQILADGLFHLLMYVLTLAGLWLLWRGRDGLSTGSDKMLVGIAMIGFGLWHVLDGVASHWLLGIHRIKMDAEIPLLWDLAWLILFGLFPIIAGWLLARGKPWSSRNGGAAATLAALAVLGGAGAAMPPSDASAIVVVFRPGLAPSQAMRAVSDVGGRLIWTDQSDQVWAIELPQPGRSRELYLQGAIFVSSAGLPAGCFGWIET